MRSLLKLAFLCGAFLNNPALAHKASDAYLFTSEQNLQISVALKDLDASIQNLDANDDRNLTWSEVKAAMPQIIGLVDQGIQLRCEDLSFAVKWKFESLEDRPDGKYVRLRTRIDCSQASSLTLTYDLFSTVDQSHRLIVAGTQNANAIAGLMIPGDKKSLRLRSASNAGTSKPNDTDSAQGVLTQSAIVSAGASGGLAVALQFFPSGVEHILTGYDHLAFLLALLLPISISRGRSNVWQLVRTVTGFTIGHSLTLILANLGYFKVPSSIVEPLIALTIIATAVLNLYPLRFFRADVLALLFGLIHGLGFSGVMLEAGITGGLLLWGLAGFNLGVEAGQLLVVLAWCLFQWFVFPQTTRHAVVAKCGSWLLIALGFIWLIQRV